MANGTVIAVAAQEILAELGSETQREKEEVNEYILIDFLFFSLKNSYMINLQLRKELFFELF